VINQYPAEGASVAEESNPKAIAKWGKVKVLCLVPQEKLAGLHLPAGIVSAIETVDWRRLADHRFGADNPRPKA
jgi:hypothetical protein